MIRNFEDFCNAVLECGFSMGGENSEGIYSLSSIYADNIEWHTDNPETDPWEWRMRVLEERTDIAYAKVFFRKSGWITKEWYPYFLKARRKGLTLDEQYAEGMISNEAKRIYDVVSANEKIPFHLIKQYSGFTKENKSKFERALTELQMKMHITMCGRQQKISTKGEAYGWYATLFCISERFWGSDVFQKADCIDEKEAVMKITEQIYRINPDANEKKIKRFIYG